MEQNDMLKGIMVGSCLGGIAALLLAPMSGKELRHEIEDCCSAVTDQTKEYYDEITEQAHNLKEQAQKYAGWAEEKNDNKALILGVLLGAVVGSLAALLIAPQNSKQLRKQLGNKYEEFRDKAEAAVENLPSQAGQKLEEWKDIFSTLMTKISSPKRKVCGKSTGLDLEDIAGWATLGMRVVHALQGKR